MHRNGAHYKWPHRETYPRCYRALRNPLFLRSHHQNSNPLAMPVTIKKPIPFSRGVLALALCAITTLSLVPVTGAIAVNVWDKAQHAGAYIVLGLLTWAAGNRANIPFTHATWLFAYGIGIELVQGFLPWRSFSVLDMLANGTGIAIAALGMAAVHRIGLFAIKNSDAIDQ